MGGTSLPDLQAYYIASQLSHMYYFNTTERQRYRALVFDNLENPLTSPLHAIFRGGQVRRRPSRCNDGMLSHHQKNWVITLHKLKLGHIHSHTPLWKNSHMLELQQIPDPTIWASYGILYLHQVMTTTGPISFRTLKEEYSLPHHLLFRYLQLCHALRSQFNNSTPLLPLIALKYWI